MFTKNNIDYRNPKFKEKDNLEEFTLRNMDTINLKSEDHIKTKSLILAPFNTSAGTEEFLNTKIELNNDIIKINGKVRELNKNYELNNNGEIDNGMIISPNGNTFNSLNNKSIDENNNFSNFNNKSTDKTNNINKNKTSMIMSLRGSGLCSPVPDEMIDIKKKNNLINNFNKNNERKIITINLNNNVLYLYEDLLNQIISFGYSYNFLVKSLINNDLNYATASYYLLDKEE